MAVNSVKITQLVGADSIKDDDVFLISTAKTGGAPDTIPYTSKQLSFKNLFKSLKSKIASWKANITELWTFEKGIKTNTVDEKDDKSVVNIGHIKNMMIGGNYPDNMIMPSYVGMIIHSTTLNTLAEVKKRYGENTNWIQLTGDYVIKPANTNHQAKLRSDEKDEGKNEVTLTLKNIPQYNYSLINKDNKSHNIDVTIDKSKSNVSLDYTPWNVQGGSNTPVMYAGSAKKPSIKDNQHKHDARISSQSILNNIILKRSESNITSFVVDLHVSTKYVYIWERIKNDSDAK